MVTIKPCGQWEVSAVTGPLPHPAALPSLRMCLTPAQEGDVATPPLAGSGDGEMARGPESSLCPAVGVLSYRTTPRMTKPLPTHTRIRSATPLPEPLQKSVPSGLPKQTQKMGPGTLETLLLEVSPGPPLPRRSCLPHQMLCFSGFTCASLEQALQEVLNQYGTRTQTQERYLNTCTI